MALTAPTNLTAEVLSSSQVLLTWGEVPEATAHRVYKDGTIVAIANASWVDNAFNPAATTVYEVRGFQIIFSDPDQGSTTPDPDTIEPIEPEVVLGPAATVTLTPDDAGVPDPPDTLAAPQGLAAEQTGLGEVTLTWELLTPATHIDIDIDGSVTRIPADVSYTETGITEGVTRTYRIRAVSEASSPEVVSDYTNTVDITLVALGIPDPNVTVQSSTRIFVDWAEVPAATSYDIEIDGQVVNLGDFPGILDAGLEPVTTRTYRVRALSGATTGDWSAEVTGTTFRTVTLTITGEPRRQSYFPSDRHITARALEKEFNNLHALAAGGTLTPSGTDPDPDPVVPLPDPVTPPTPPPDPAPVDPDPPAPTPSPDPPAPSVFPPAPSGSDPAHPAGWSRETTPDADNPGVTKTSWQDLFGAPFPFGDAVNLRIDQNKYLALDFNSGTVGRFGQIDFADLTGNIVGVGQRPALVTISPYEGDFRLSLGAPYYRLVGVGGTSPSYSWTRTQGDPARAYIPPNTSLYFNITFVSTASEGAPAGSLVWQCTSFFPTLCGYRLQNIVVT